ncbi:hypothetical protein M9Y10_022539 [Tritrichomonas musculus]|uniref:VHS domain-containing protein n=1 Tax=Tritrichomonas musculus TaxID=1915356 RepID=A0ABR2KUI5_9EUKA
MEIEGNFQLQAENLVKKAISGAPGSPDWSTILRILGIIYSSSSAIPTFISIICNHLARGKKGVSLNCLILIDALFKNSKKPQLILLQSPQLIQQLNSPLIQRNPELHNFIYKFAPVWVSSCAAQNCLDDYFESWQNSMCKTYYVPKMTPSIKSKLNNDLDASLDVLIIFSQCLITSFLDGKGPSDPLLHEILPNVREISKRLNDLEPTVIDKEIRSAISTERSFCELCQHTMVEFKRTLKIDTESFINLVRKYQNKVKKYLHSETLDGKSKEKKRTPLRHRGQLFDEMSVDDFFAEFDKIKKKSIGEQKQPQNSQKTEENLLDFGSDLNPIPNNDPNQDKSAMDDLIDSFL